ncbi:hypothetical protein VUR80DRAFT_9510 [Thermomyces stellatus]
MGKKSKSTTGSAGGRITDSRFASFETDPRFRLPSTKKTKTTIDKRFARMLDSDEFTSAAKVDKYGRRLKSDAGKKALENLYRQEEEEEKDEDEEKDDDGKSGEDEASADEEDEVPEIDDNEVEKQLEAAKSYDPARDGGFSTSESEESDVEEVEEDVDVGASMQRFADEQAEVEEGEVTNRFAVVNMDWDYVKSHDLFALFSSFLNNVDGKVEKVSIYPSEFGKERMRREEVEGPPKEIFRKSKREESDAELSDSEAEDEKIKNELLKDGDDADFDSDALRAYQLDRLRYYYAVVICSDPKTAKAIYDATDGTEYLSSSNFIDLRFIPDDVTFDDEPRDECTSVPDDYEPVDFTTNALQSSKVKLTWDMHPEEATRKQSMRKAFSGSRAEIQEDDLRAYLASDSEDEEGDAKEEAKKKLRAALGLGDDGEKGENGAKDGPVGDMEITFTSALLDQPKEEREETTIEKYKRKEKERRQRRKERAMANRKERGEGTSEKPTDGEDLGFDDPFFTTEEPEVSKSQLRKEEKRKKREAREAETAEKAEEKERLQKMMDEGEQEDGMDRFQHFDMKEIMRAEKEKNKKKKKKGKKDADKAPAADEGKVPVLDDRFKAMFESHEYAVDTSNPQYTRTETMQKMLEEGRKRKNAGDGEDGERKGKKKRKEAEADLDLNGLVASVKQKAR